MWPYGTGGYPHVMHHQPAPAFVQQCGTQYPFQPQYGAFQPQLQPMPYHPQFKFSQHYQQPATEQYYSTSYPAPSTAPTPASTSFSSSGFDSFFGSTTTSVPAPSTGFDSFFGSATTSVPAPSTVTEKNLGAQVHLQKVGVTGDGRCLFRSIARSMAMSEGMQISQEEEQQTADQLRALAHRIISVDQKPWFEESGAIEGNFQDYCRRMQAPTFYGGEVEMLALSDALQRPITVFIQHQMGGYRSIAEYGVQYRMTSPIVKLYYNGHNHYDCLI